jgi:dTDP-4-amino-4,6-dideoxygalactose transaminase
VKPLRYSTQQITEDDITAVTAVLRSDWLTCGPAVEAFEAALCEYTGAKYAVAVNSGTAALYLAYRAAHKARIMTSPLTFVATANAALLAGLDEMFHDVVPATGNVDLPGYSDCISVPVHFAGRAAPIPKTGVVIEDACHALGAMDYDGCSRVGSCEHSLASCFSFHPVKPITTGEGGAVTTNDEGFAAEVRSLRDHGREDGLMVSLSGNFRMPDINAALGLSQLKRCDEMRERRAELAVHYAHELCAVRGMWCPSGWVEKDAWHLYAVRIKNGRRDEVKAKLNAQGIGAQVHYNPPVHLHPYYRQRFGYEPGDFPEAEAWASEELSLPLHAGMTGADVERVVTALREALR